MHRGMPKPRDDLLGVAIDVSVELGKMLLNERPTDIQTDEKSSPVDVVTEMDRAGELRARQALARYRPDDAICGEEGVREPGTSGVTWVIDPIDGTTNYLYRLPLWAVSVAAVVDGRIEAGCVHAPAVDMTFTAARSLGAHLVQGGHRSALSVSTAGRLDHSLIATGFGYGSTRRAGQGRVLAEVLPQVRDVRRSGAASMDLCWVAAGWLDGYYERGLHVWDYAAGALIVSEAGGDVSWLAGGAIEPLLIHDGEEPTLIAATPGVKDELHAVLIAASADQVP